MIALPRSLHEVSLHVSPRLCAAGLVASRVYWRGRARIVPDSLDGTISRLPGWPACLHTVRRSAVSAARGRSNTMMAIFGAILPRFVLLVGWVERPDGLDVALQFAGLVPVRLPVLPVDHARLRLLRAERHELPQLGLRRGRPADRPRDVGHRRLRDAAAGVELPRHLARDRRFGAIQSFDAGPSGRRLRVRRPVADLYVNVKVVVSSGGR